MISINCFYVPGSKSIIDTIGANGLSSICGESLEQIRQRYPQAEVWDLDQAIEQIQQITYATTIEAPKEVTFDRWEEMKNVMPPMKWRGGDSTESFMICEATTLDLHSIFCRIGSRFFEMTDKRSLTHNEIVSACSKVLEAESNV